MANPYIWSGLDRAVNDPTKIDEAIGEAVAAHNDDPDAHLGPNQALESHRASEIIDHRAESVVNDKIARQARRYIAIVDPNSESDFDTVQSALDYAVSVGGGDIFVVPGEHEITADISLPRTCGLYGNGDGESIIKSNNTTNRKITIQERLNRATLYMEDLNATTTSPNFSCGYFEESFEPYMVGLPVFDTQNENHLGFVASFNEGTNSGVLTANSKANAVNAVGYIQEGCEATNGSNAVKVYTDSDAFRVNYYAGSSINIEWAGERYKIIAQEDDNTLVLDRTYTGPTMISPCYVTDTARRTVNIEGVQLGNADADVALMGTAGNGATIIRDCTIYTNRTRMILGGRTFMDNVVMRMGSVGGTYVLGELRATDSVFYAESSTASGIEVSYGTRIEQCEWTGQGVSYNNPITFAGTNVVVERCVIATRSAWAPTYSHLTLQSLGVTLTDNTFFIAGTGTITFAGRHWRISGNRFDRSTGGGVTLGTNCYYSIFTDNFMNGTVTNSGTGNVVANNISTR